MAVLKGKTRLVGDIEEKNVWYVIQRRSKLRKGFSLIMDDGLIILSQLDLTRHEYRLMLFLISQIEFDNCCYITQSFMSEKLSIAQSNISKTLKLLESRNLIFRESTNKGKSIRVSSVIAWRGKTDSEYTNRFAADSKCLKVPDHIISGLIQ
jgi:DNA-binding MarR family transcriptional regulator